jgi:GntR family transcriptional regulator, transcriptional repressor for pyruvate dehydrogenase complex
VTVRGVRRENLPSTIAAQLRRQILAGELEPGARLPGHRELATMFAVSVGSVREAISMLISAGLVETQAGRGTYVAARPGTAAVGLDAESPDGGSGGTLERKEVEELVEAREVIEVELAGMAAARGTPEQFQRLRACVQRMDVAASSPFDYPDADVEFHLALAEAAGNRYLLRAMLDIRSLLKQDMELGAEAAIRRFGDLGVSVESHRGLVDAIEAGDVDLARETAGVIVRRNREFVLGLYAMAPPASHAFG